MAWKKKKRRFESVRPKNCARRTENIQWTKKTGEQKGERERKKKTGPVITRSHHCERGFDLYKFHETMAEPRRPWIFHFDVSFDQIFAERNGSRMASQWALIDSLLRSPTNVYEHPLFQFPVGKMRNYIDDYWNDTDSFIDTSWAHVSLPFFRSFCLWGRFILPYMIINEDEKSLEKPYINSRSILFLFIQFSTWKIKLFGGIVKIWKEGRNTPSERHRNGANLNSPR